METKVIVSVTVTSFSSLYSLEKLIEWKLDASMAFDLIRVTLYSLEKLIEWKPIPSVAIFSLMGISLLAREINWMETKAPLDPWISSPNSLLAREINWMETPALFTVECFPWHSLLAREINWMETVSFSHFVIHATISFSLLAREINWMETLPSLVCSITPLILSTR